MVCCMWMGNGVEALRKILDEDGWSAEKKIDAVRKLLDEALEK